MLNRRGGELIDTSRPPPAPITLPKLNLPDIDIEAEALAAAARIAERRTIRAGIDAWLAINKAEILRGLESNRRGLDGRQSSCVESHRSQCGMGQKLQPGIQSVDSSSTASTRCRQRPGAWPSSFTNMPRRLPLGAMGCRSASASGSFIRYRSQDAGEPLQRTATASAPQTYGATLRQRGRVSVPV